MTALAPSTLMGLTTPATVRGGLGRLLAPARPALAHARHHALRTALLILCVFVTALLPLATRVVLGDFQERLLARARSTPLLAGASGSRFDLVMSTLYFRKADLATLTMRDWRAIAESGMAGAFPVNSRFTARGRPLVATTPDYFQFRGLRIERGGLPTTLGQAVLGARAARELGLGPGDALFSDQREMFDISKPPALKMLVTGVFAPIGTPDDQAVFTDIKTAWVLEGLSHGHADATKSIPGSLVMDRTKDQVVVSEELVDYNEVTPANIGTFHLHGDPDALPVTAVIVVPRSTKEMSIVKARTNAGASGGARGAQMVIPSEAVEEMLGYVARLRHLLDALSVVMLAFATVLLGLVLALSIRVRSGEISTLARIGVARSTIAAIFAWELAGIVASGLVLAAVVAAVLHAAPPDLVKLL